MKTIKFLSIFMMAALTFVGCQKSNVVEESVIAEQTTAKKGMEMYTVDFDALNMSGVDGYANLTLDGSMLTVEIHATGMEPNIVHPQHIHGFVDSNANSMCPPMSADTDNDGLLEIGEGAPFYGPPILFLEPFPTADASGEIHYMETFNLTQEQLDLLHPLQNNTIVLHGAVVNGTPILTLPVACGQISKAKSKGKGNK